MLSAELRAVAAAEIAEIETGRDHRDRSGDTVLGEHGGELLRRRDYGVHGVALPARYAARECASEGARNQRKVVMQILFEERVVSLERLATELASDLEADAMRDERRLDVDEIDALPQLEAGRQRGAADHHPILRIEDEVTRRLAQHAGLCVARAGIRRRDQPALATERREVTPENLDRGGDTVDAREIHVRDHQHTHGAP